MQWNAEKTKCKGLKSNNKWNKSSNFKVIVVGMYQVFQLFCPLTHFKVGLMVLNTYSTCFSSICLSWVSNRDEYKEVFGTGCSKATYK